MTVKKTVFLMLADGFEETEAIVPVDVLRRLEIHLETVGIARDHVTSSHGVVIRADRTLDTTDLTSADAIILPGGLPGATHLRDCAPLIEALRQMASMGKITAAICAAPIVLERAGLTAGKRITGYPGTEALAPGLVYTGELVEQDGAILTGRGPGASFAFAARVALALGKTQEEVDALYQRMLIRT